MSNTHGQWLERIRGKEHRKSMFEVPYGRDPCADTISRQDAIDEIRKCRFVVDAIEKIRGLPSAHPKLSCDGCKYRGWPTTDMPCRACIRKEYNDYYEPEE